MTSDDKITELFSEHADSLLRMCYLYLKDRALAEDAVSETFMKAYRNFDKFNGLSTEKTWLTRIAINCCKSICRSKKYHEGYLELDEVLPDKNDYFSKRDEQIIVSNEISKLPIKYRETIILYYYKELTTAEVARVLRIPRTTVDYRLRFAKKILKQTLKECYFDE